MKKFLSKQNELETIVNSLIGTKDIDILYSDTLLANDFESFNLNTSNTNNSNITSNTFNQVSNQASNCQKNLITNYKNNFLIRLKIIFLICGINKSKLEKSFQETLKKIANQLKINLFNLDNGVFSEKDKKELILYIHE